MVLTVFPFVPNQPIMSVSFTLTTSATATLAMSATGTLAASQPGGISVSISAISSLDVGLIKPVMGMDDGWTEFDFSKQGPRTIFTNRTNPPVAVNVEVKVDVKQGSVIVIVDTPRGKKVYPPVSNEGEGVDDTSVVTVTPGGTIVIQDGGAQKKAKGKVKTRVP